MGSGTSGPLVVDLDTAALRDPRDGQLLGGPANALFSLARTGVPVPAGFAITEAACDLIASDGSMPDGLWTEVDRAVGRLERRSGLRLGDPERPLLLSVLGGLPDPTAGPVTGIGMNDMVAAALTAQGVARFARATYAQLLRSYGGVVLGVGPDHFDHDPEDSPAGLLRDLAGEGLPQDPLTQMRRVIDALALSRRTHRAGSARDHGHSARSVAVVQLVSGDRDARSGCGVVYSRDPVTGAPGPVVEYLGRATVGELEAGERMPLDLAALQALEPDAHADLTRLCAALEHRLGDVCVIEFVVETGRLWVHDAAVGERSADAAFRIAASFVDEGAIGLDEALRRVDGAQLAALLRPTTLSVDRSRVVLTGRPGSPGSAAGRLALDALTAREWVARGERPVLALAHPGLHDLVDAPEWAAVVTDLPPLCSPAVRDLRRLSVPCVAGLHGMQVDGAARTLTLPGGTRLAEGALLIVDGTAGLVLQGRHETRPSAVSIAVQGPPAGVSSGVVGGAAAQPDDPTARAVRMLLDHADRVRHLEVHANAETPEEARIARRLGAQGIGLCRTEHLLLGPRRELVERLLTGVDRAGALEAIESFTVSDFAAILEVMDGLPVVVRLLDPPLREFLPDLVDLSVEMAIAEERGHLDDRLQRRLLAVRRWSETNPLLGLRGVRILTVLPQIVDVQVRALAAATVSLRSRGRDPRPLIMIPLVADVAELSAARSRVERIVAEVARASGLDLEIPVGVMIELPRAALTAAAMAGAADFFSFGTNDLTQTVWGISHDDAEATFLTAYRESGILRGDPFVTLDEHGVGRLVRLAAEEGRAARPGLGLGACGRHVEDPASVGFFARVGVDYLSCTTPHLPVIRLQAGHEAVLETARQSFDRPPTESG